MLMVHVQVWGSARCSLVDCMMQDDSGADPLANALGTGGNPLRQAKQGLACNVG